MGDADHATLHPLANGKTRIDFQTEPARYGIGSLRSTATSPR